MIHNVIFGWVVRRVPELAGILTMVFSLYGSLPPQHQETVWSVLQGEGGGLTISTVIGLAIYVGSQVMSFRATVRPQVVTEQGEKIKTKQIPVTKKTEIERAARASPETPTVFEKLLGKFGF